MKAYVIDPVLGTVNPMREMTEEAIRKALGFALLERGEPDDFFEPEIVYPLNIEIDDEQVTFFTREQPLYFVLSHYFRPIKANKFKIYGKAVVLSNLTFTAEDFYFKWNQARLPPPDLLDYWQKWKSKSEAEFMNRLREVQALVGATSAPAPDSFGIMMRSMYSKGSIIIRVLDILDYVESKSKSPGSTYSSPPFSVI